MAAPAAGQYKRRRLPAFNALEVAKVQFLDYQKACGKIRPTLSRFYDISNNISLLQHEAGQLDVCVQ